MKQRILILLLLLPGTGYGQNWNEFFKQKKTQKKYLLEQLVALRAYAGFALQGYQAVHSGLKTVRGLTGGELSLHEVFFSSLSGAGPVIRNHARLGEIILLQLRIRREFGGLNRLELTGHQQQYVESVRERVLKDCLEDLDALALLLADGGLEMEDADRLDRLERIHAGMQEKREFTGSFVSGIRSLVLLKERTVRDAEASRRLHGVSDSENQNQ